MEENKNMNQTTLDGTVPIEESITLLKDSIRELE
jgi:hypothetical protein